MIKPSDRPRLKRHARLRLDDLSGSGFVLYPEKGLQLNPTGLRILCLCEAGATFAEIVAVLASETAASAEGVSADVADFLNALGRRGLLEGLSA